MKLSSQIIALASLATGLASAASAAVDTYTIDPVHSSVGFTIRHIVGKVPGRFTQFSGTILVDSDTPENDSVSAVIQVGSVDTDNDKRNAHLKTPDFFDAEKFATITFKSKSWKKTADNAYDVTGDLTIKDITKEVVLKVTSFGSAPGMKGAKVAGWEASTTLSRSAFGVVGPAQMPAAMLGDDVGVSILIEAHTAPAADAAK